MGRSRGLPLGCFFFFFLGGVSERGEFSFPQLQPPQPSTPYPNPPFPRPRWGKEGSFRGSHTLPPFRGPATVSPSKTPQP